MPGRPNFLPNNSGGATDLKLHLSDQQVNAVLGYAAPDKNVLNEYQEYIEYIIRLLQLKSLPIFSTDYNCLVY